MADDKGNGTQAHPTTSVLKRPASQVPAAQTERSAQKAAVSQVFNPAPAAAPLDAAHIKPGDILRVHVDPRHVVGSEQADHGPNPRPWVVISMRRAHKMPLNLVVAVPLTTVLKHQGQFREARIAVPDHDITALDESWTAEDSLALTEQVRAISVQRCSCKLGEVSPRILSSLRTAVGYIIGLVG